MWFLSCWFLSYPHSLEWLWECAPSVWAGSLPGKVSVHTTCTIALLLCGPAKPTHCPPLCAGRILLSTLTTPSCYTTQTSRVMLQSSLSSLRASFASTSQQTQTQRYMESDYVTYCSFIHHFSLIPSLLWAQGGGYKSLGIRSQELGMRLQEFGISLGKRLQEFGDQVTRAGNEATRVWGSGHKSLGMRLQEFGDQVIRAWEWGHWYTLED